MKKIFLTLTFVSLCSLTTFAGDGDGTTHSGGKTCPQGQQTCFVELPQETKNETVYIEILDYLKELFG